MQCLGTIYILMEWTSLELSPRRICFNNVYPSWNVSDIGLKKITLTDIMSRVKTEIQRTILPGIFSSVWGLSQSYRNWTSFGTYLTDWRKDVQSMEMGHTGRVVHWVKTEDPNEFSFRMLYLWSLQDLHTMNPREWLNNWVCRPWWGLMGDNLSSGVISALESYIGVWTIT